MYGNEIKGVGCAATTARESVAMEVVNMTASLAERAEILAGRVTNKLEPVTTQPCPRPTGGIGKESREYPPLFSELRNRLTSLAQSLDTIEDAIQRTEL